jgi:putative DNA primase/helicase
MAITIDEGKALVAQMCRQYPAALALGFRLRQTARELYPHSEDDLSLFLAAYDPTPILHDERVLQGRVDLAVSQARDARSALETLRHEILGHYGINTFTTAQKTAMLDALIAARGQRGLFGLWEHVDLMYPDKDIYMRAEEVYATCCETLSSPSRPGPDAKRIQREGESSFQETCVDRSRLMKFSDLVCIAQMVAQGLHDRSRRQQHFPEQVLDELEQRATMLRQASTFEEARVVAEVFKGKPLNTRDGTMRAVLSRNNLDKILSGKAVGKSDSPALHALAVANLDHLFYQAIQGWSHTDHKQDPNLKAVHRLFAPMLTEGRIKLVKLTVKESALPNQANRIYSVEALSVNEKSPVPEMVDADRTKGSRLLTGPTGLVSILVNNIQNYNRDRGTPYIEHRYGAPEEAFRAAMRSLGLETSDEHPIRDGKPHRVRAEGDKRGETAGYYTYHADNRPAGYIKNYRTGEELRWRAEGTQTPPPNAEARRAQMVAEMAERQRLRLVEQEAVAQKVRARIDTLLPVYTPTPYLVSKGIAPQGGILTDPRGTTYIPAYDTNGTVWTMQRITDSGQKRFETGGRKEGCFHVVGGLEKLQTAGVLLIAEGYATAASINKATNRPVVVAFDAGNLKSVARALQKQFPTTPIVICGDDDRRADGKNPGREMAKSAACAVEGRAVLPRFAPDEVAAKDFSDFNDLATKSRLGEQAVRRQIEPVVQAAQACARASNTDQRQDAPLSKLVEHGEASFGNKPGKSYFAVLENDQGERRTLWGADLKRAIRESAARIGDRVNIECVGSETVRLSNGQNAKRNTWQVNFGKNQPQMHADAMHQTPVHLEALRKNPALVNRSMIELERLAYWRGIAFESIRSKPEPVQNDALRKFDQAAENPDFLKRLERSVDRLPVGNGARKDVELSL